MQRHSTKRDQKLGKLYLRYREGGDTRALGKLFDALSPELLRVARHVSGDPAEAEDLVQATFLVALGHPERYDEGQPIEAWMVGILTKEALAWRRKAARRPDEDRVLEPKLDREKEARPDVQTAQKEGGQLLLNSLKRLPIPYREVLTRHLLQGQTPTEIAQDCQMPAATVRVQMHRGLARLRQILPAGYAAGVALTLSERGLAAMRSELISHASHLSASGLAAASGSGLAGSVSTIKILGSLFMIKRIGIAVALSAVLFFGYRVMNAANSGGASLTSSGGLTDLQEPVAPPPILAELESTGRLSAAGPKAPGWQGDKTEADQDVALGSLWVNTLWADGTAAPNISFRYLSFATHKELKEATTDGEGRIKLIELIPGKYALYGDRSGHVTAHVPGRIQGSGSAQPPVGSVTLTLATGTDVTGRVVDSDGRAVEGAEIFMTGELTRASGFVLAKSEADGTFALRQLGADCFVGARAQGFAPSQPQHVQHWKDRQQATDAIQLELVLPERSPTLRGVVFDPDGQPLSGARVRVGAQEGFGTFGPKGAEGPPPPIETLTDENGAFACSTLMPGTISVAVRATGYPDRVQTVDCESGRDGSIEIRLENAAWVRGFIVGSDGQGLSKVSIHASPKAYVPGELRNSFRGHQVATDSKGAFLLGPLQPTEMVLHAQSRNGKAKTNATLKLQPGETTNWTGLLESMPTIAGQAVDVHGAGLAGWSVLATPAQVAFPTPRATRTDEQGRFEIVLNVDGPHRLELFAPDSEDSQWIANSAPRTWLDSVPSGTKDVRLAINPNQEPSASLSGECIPLLGAQVPEIKATIYHPELGELTQVKWPANQGRFELAHLPAGSLTLKLEPAGLATLWIRDVEVQHAEAKDIGRISLQEGGDLSVQISMRVGSVLGNADVQLAAQGEAFFPVSVGERNAEVRDLAPGFYELRVHAQDAAPYAERIEIKAGEKAKVAVLLEAGGSIGFGGADGNGDPLAEDMHLTVTAANGQVLVAQTVERGDRPGPTHWLFAPFGELQVVATTESGLRCETRVVLRSSDEAGGMRVLKLK